MAELHGYAVEFLDYGGLDIGFLLQYGYLHSFPTLITVTQPNSHMEGICLMEPWHGTQATECASWVGAPVSA